MRIKKDFILFTFLVVLGISTRTIFHVAANVEFVTAISLASGFFIKRKKIAFATTGLVMFISDILIGNSVIFIYTWSAFLLFPVLGTILAKQKFIRSNSLITVLFATSSSVVSTLIFFFWTNFGVVVTTSMYTKDISGLIHSYINGLPFLFNQLLGNMIITPMLFVSILLFTKLLDKLSFTHSFYFKH